MSPRRRDAYSTHSYSYVNSFLTLFFKFMLFYRAQLEPINTVMQHSLIFDAKHRFIIQSYCLK